jgi:putative acetyltransferase
MDKVLSIIRTTTSDPDFQALVARLDHELWNELKEDQATYDPFNKVPDIDTAVLAYADQAPVACGCFKPFDAVTVEVKRMFVDKAWRGKGVSKKILEALEQWAIEKHYRFAVLETSIHFNVATGLYRRSGYEIIPNYPPYAGLEESVCMRKQLN